MTLTEITGWLGALGALAVFVYLGYASVSYTHLTLPTTPYV